MNSRRKIIASLFMASFLCFTFSVLPVHAETDLKAPLDAAFSEAPASDSNANTTTTNPESSGVIINQDNSVTPDTSTTPEATPSTSSSNENTVITQDTPSTQSVQEEPYTLTEMSATMKVTSSDLNVRKGPSKTYESLGSLSEGDTVNVTGKASTGWYRIKFKGSDGFVSDKYLEEIASEPTQEEIKETSAETTPETQSTEEESTSGLPFQFSVTTLILVVAIVVIVVILIITIVSFLRKDDDDDDDDDFDEDDEGYPGYRRKRPAPRDEAPRREAPVKRAPVKREAPKKEAPKKEAVKKEAPKKKEAPVKKPHAIKEEPIRKEAPVKNVPHSYHEEYDEPEYEDDMYEEPEYIENDYEGTEYVDSSYEEDDDDYDANLAETTAKLLELQEELERLKKKK